VSIKNIDSGHEIQAIDKDLGNSEERFRLLVDAVHDYAIITLDTNGIITNWNSGAERAFLFTADEVVGKNVSMLSTGEVTSKPELTKEQMMALQVGRFEEEAWRIRRDGTQFWANIIVTPIFNKERDLTGYAKVVRNLTERKKNEDQLKKMTVDLTEQAAVLKSVNHELEAFCYSVSHDLRAPLRSMNGFSRALLEDYSDKLDSQGKDYLNRISTSAKFMGDLIDGLLNLSRVSRQPISKEAIHLSALVQNLFTEIQHHRKDKNITIEVEKGLISQGDPALLRTVVYNLLDNAFKFTKKTVDRRITFGHSSLEGKIAYFFKDNGFGFDMRYKDKLFRPFQRLHSAQEFEGTGMGLATVQRIIHRHGGDVWAEAALGSGAKFYFSLGS